MGPDAGPTPVLSAVRVRALAPRLDEPEYCTDIGGTAEFTEAQFMGDAMFAEAQFTSGATRFDTTRFEQGTPPEIANVRLARGCQHHGGRFGMLGGRARAGGTPLRRRKGDSSARSGK